MPESTAYARRSYSGAASDTTLVSGITSGATSLDAADLSTWSAADDNGPGRATLTDGTNEEEVEFTAVSGNSLTGLSRGVGGTTAQAWSPGVTVSHRSSQRDFDEANYAVSQTVGKITAAGDLLYATAAGVFARLAKGTARQVLAMNSGATAPEWVASLQSLLTAAGDIIYASAANTPARLAKGTAGQQLVMNAGATAPEWASKTFAGALIRNNADQTVNNSAAAAIAFQAEDADTATYHDNASNNTRLTVPTTGKYRLSWTVNWVNGATVSGLISTYLKVNGTTTPDEGYVLVRPEELSASNSQTRIGSTVLVLTAADYVELFFDNASGSNASVKGTSGQTSMQIEYLGA